MIRPCIGLLSLVILAAAGGPCLAASAESYLKKPPEWFRSEEGRRITTNILSWQSSVGSWPKNQDNTQEPFTGDPGKIAGTFDNQATTGELRFLARATTVTQDPACRAAVLKAIDLLLKAQYPTGGWPQFYPTSAKSYQRYITFNDGAMVRIMETLRRVASEEDFAFVDAKRRAAAGKAFEAGIACILRSQVRVNDTLTVWCAQHDEITLEPRAARAFELASLSGGESAGILRLLMSVPKPGPELRRAIEAGAQWYEKNRILGLRQTEGSDGKQVVADPAARPLWARFYDLKTGRPIFVDRDGVPRERLDQVGRERRDGYAWYGTWGDQVAKDFTKWEARRE